MIHSKRPEKEIVFITAQMKQESNWKPEAPAATAKTTIFRKHPLVLIYFNNIAREDNLDNFLK